MTNEQYIINLQERLVKYYKYNKLPEDISDKIMQKYLIYIPSKFINNVSKNWIGYQINGKNIELYTLNNTKIAHKYNRIVVGHYGAFIEISNNDIIKLSLKIKEGQEFRLTNKLYNIKYQWWTPIDNSNCKLYYQLRGVRYADYKSGYWYISPYEVM